MRHPNAHNLQVTSDADLGGNQSESVVDPNDECSGVVDVPDSNNIDGMVIDGDVRQGDSSDHALPQSPDGGPAASGCSVEEEYHVHRSALAGHTLCSTDDVLDLDPLTKNLTVSRE